MSKTMGGFMAALRRARGMTQQEVADRLNVSNKTISKWERDDGYPEITIIPALAELFEVTSDEILRGERIPQPGQEREKQAAKTEKQIRRLINSSVTRFQNFSCLAAALALAGWITLFTIAYTFYRPLLGFGIMLILIIASVTTQFFSINTARASTGDHEISADRQKLLLPLQKTINRYTFAVFMSNAAVIILSLPFILIRDSFYVESVISLNTYLAWLPVLLIIIALCGLLFLNLLQNKLFIEKKSWPGGYPAEKMRRMNLIQGGALLLSFVPVAIDYRLSSAKLFLIAMFYLLFIFAIIYLLTVVIKSRAGTERLLLLAAGSRNLLYAIALLYFSSGSTVIHTAEGEIFHHFEFKAGPPLLFLGAAAAYLLAKYFIWRQSSPIQPEGPESRGG